MFEDIIRKMSLEDKIAICSGADAWHTKKYDKYGIPAIMMTDGPHGLRKQSEKTEQEFSMDGEPATCFPTATVLASTWNRELVKEIGAAIGEEAQAAGVNLVLGPGVNMKRNPLCGRNFEYYSEDPYLAGELASEWINGVKSKGVEACVKHFACNNQENNRMTSNSMVDERTLREFYIAAFERVIKKSKPGTVMCSYNMLNGTYLSDNKRMLTDILRDEWGFDGLVVSDWTATHDRVEAFKAGMDLEMPTSHGAFDKEVKEAVLNGELDEKYIDKSVERILKLLYDTVTDYAGNKNKEAMIDEHDALALRAAQEGGVLLKNENHTLPLQEDEEILVIGAMAKQTRFQGAGSSAINSYRKTSVLDALNNRNLPFSYARGYELENKRNDILKMQAVEAAISSKKIVVVLGLTDAYDSEGMDRKHMKLPGNQLELLKAVTEVNKNIVVVLVGGGVVEMPWLKCVNGLIHMQLAGQAAGAAVVDLLYGYANPSGRLAESYPIKYEDIPNSHIFGICPKQAEYREGLYVGYRYYERAGKKVRFPFGYGLSYTRFEYSQLNVTKRENGAVASFTVKNIGDRDGAEVAQLYIADKTGGVHRPMKELKGFRKVFLKAGEAVNIEIELENRDFAYYDVDKKDWLVQRGEYGILVGGSSADIYLTAGIEMNGVEPVRDGSAEWYYKPEGKPTRKDFETIYGREIYDYIPAVKGTYTIYNTIADLQETSMICRGLLGMIEKLMAKGNGGKVDYHNPAFRMMVETAAQTPLANLRLSLGNKVSLKTVRRIVRIANGFNKIDD